MIVKSTGCGFDPYSKKINIKLHLYFYFSALVSRQSATLSYVFQHAMRPELGAIQREIDLFIFTLLYKKKY